MRITKITALEERTNKFTNELETPVMISFTSHVINPKLAGMKLAAPEGTKYGNIFVDNLTYAEACERFSLGTDYSEWLEFGEQVANADGEAIPNCFKILQKT